MVRATAAAAMSAVRVQRAPPRRRFLRASAAAACALAAPAFARAARSRVVVVGGGFGGATAARYLRLWGGDRVHVTLVEREPRFVSCPLSNLVLSGSRSITDVTVGYERLERRGVRIVRDVATAVDPDRRVVRL